MEQVTKLDFKGQSIYVGIDVHKKSWTATFNAKAGMLKLFSNDPATNFSTVIFDIQYLDVLKANDAAEKPYLGPHSAVNQMG